MVSIAEMFSIVGLSVSFIGASILAFNSITSREQILKETSTGQTVVINNERRKEVGLEKAMEEAKSKMPDVQAKIVQSKLAKIGFSVLASGFILQLTGVHLSITSS